MPVQGRWPNLERWFAAMEARPAYLGFKSDYYTHCHDLPPQLGGGLPAVACRAVLWCAWVVTQLDLREPLTFALRVLSSLG